MLTKSIAIALIVVSGGLTAAEAHARSCQTITYTHYKERCRGSYNGYHCWRIPITTTRKICMNNPPTIRRVPTPNHGRFTPPREVPPTVGRRFINNPKTPQITPRRFDTFRRAPNFNTPRVDTFRRSPNFNKRRFSVRRRS
jgi:hypothetical protein